MTDPLKREIIVYGGCMKQSVLLAGLVLAFAMLVACGKSGDAPAKGGDEGAKKQETVVSAKKRYAVKSGKIESEFGPKGITMKRVLWFDDFGAKERTELFYDGKLTEINIVDGSHKYSIRVSNSDKVAWKTAWSYGLMKEVNLDQVKNGKGITILPKMNILGFECDAYKAEYKEYVVTMAGYKGVQLLMDSTGKMAVTDKATKAEFDVEVPAGMFAVPEGYTVKDSKM